MALTRSFIPVALLGVALLAAGCSDGTRVEGAAASPGGRGGGGAAAVPITVGRVVRKPMPLDLQAIGSVEASSTVSVHAQITGQLTRVAFTEGDEVKAGAVLFTLDRRPLEAALRQAEANLQRDTAQAANAGAQAQRFVELAARGIATREQVETSRASVDALNGTIEADRAAVENARIQLQYATITAPISGRTGALMVHEGSLVRANDTTPLVVINQLTPINVAFAIPEDQLPALKRVMSRGAVGIEVQPPNDSSTRAVGRVTFIDNAVDQTTGTVRVKGSFPNAGHQLWPGQYVNVTVRLAIDPAAVVAPSAAIQTGQDGPYAYVVKTDQTVELRSVGVGRTRGEETIVTRGLAPDETVVTDGHLRLVPGSRISVRTGAAASQETR
jgi:multidrug efflux system membrane fusion protein